MSQTAAQPHVAVDVPDHDPELYSSARPAEWRGAGRLLLKRRGARPRPPLLAAPASRPILLAPQ